MKKRNVALFPDYTETVCGKEHRGSSGVLYIHKINFLWENNNERYF